MLRIPNSTIVVDSLKEPVKWDHSAQVNDFVRIVTEDRASRENHDVAGAGAAESDVLGSLRRLARALDECNVARDLSFPEVKEARLQQQQHDSSSMPPTEAVVLVLRWAKGSVSLAHFLSIYLLASDFSY